MIDGRPIVAALLVSAGSLLAQEKPLIEEILVTAQRVEENEQSVPISMSAFTDAMIEDRQIIGLTDVQLSVPNFTYTDENYGSPIVSVRGVGRFGNGTDLSPVSVHVNDIYQHYAPLTDLYDLERLEVLRGPQGTLYGRNSTAGTLNLITKRPRLEGTEAYIELDVGNYGLTRIRAAGETTVGERFGIRIAGFKLDRDGYIENLAAGDVPGMNDDLDGRDVYSFRITPRWDVTERTKLWAMYEHIREDDDRARKPNQVCRASTLPVFGCDPDAFGQDAVNQAATTFGIFAAFSDMIPLGASTATGGLEFDVPRPRLNLREQHTDTEPTYELDVDQWIFGVEHAFDFADLSFLAGYREQTARSRQDEFMDVGFTLNPTSFNPAGLWPTSRAPEPGKPLGGPCPALQGLVGVHGGCVFPTNQTRFFSYDQVYGDEEFWTVEAKLASASEGRLSWLLGAQYQDSKIDGELYRPNNVFDSVGIYGVPANQLSPIYAIPPIYALLNGGSGRDKLESYAVFGESYWAFTDAVKLTLGLRYTDDKVSKRYVPFSVSAFDLGGDWLRTELPSWLFAPEPDANAVALTDYYGLTEAARSANSFPERLSVLQQVPPIPTAGEAKGVLGLPESNSTDYVTGRIGVNWNIAPDMMAYATYNRGQKPGGFQYFASVPYDEEKLDAIEVGAKTVLFDGSLLLNVAGFYNSYDGLQYKSTEAEEVQNTDADVWGLELEARWRPTMNLGVELSYGYLNAKAKNFEQLDLLDPAQGDPSLVTLKNIDSEYVQGTNFVAPQSDVLAIIPQAVAELGALPAPGAVYPDGIPVYFSRAYLETNGVSTSDGLPADLDGNRLPLAPPHQISLGIAYTWFLRLGALTARWDYYWQDDMYARAFNTPGDKIDSWSQNNASIELTSAGGAWTVKAWIRNLEDKDNVTAQFVENPQQGNFRNYFLTEPRVYGATLRWNFGSP